MEEKGIVARDCCPRLSPAGASLPRDHLLGSAQAPPPPAAASTEAVVPWQREAGLKRETFAGNNPFLLHVVVLVLQGVKAKVPFPQFYVHHG